MAGLCIRIYIYMCIQYSVCTFVCSNFMYWLKTSINLWKWFTCKHIGHDFEDNWNHLDQAHAISGLVEKNSCPLPSRGCSDLQKCLKWPIWAQIHMFKHVNTLDIVLEAILSIPGHAFTIVLRSVKKIMSMIFRGRSDLQFSLNGLFGPKITCKHMGHMVWIINRHY